MSNALGQRAIDAFEACGISAETVARFGIYTARRVRNGDKTEVVPDADGNIIAFPFLDRAVVAEKYRQLPWAPRKTWQRKGGKRTFLNADILDDPALAQGLYPLVIVEGEPDFLTAVDCGFPFTVSVPDGAPAVPKGREPDDLDPIDHDGEATGKFEFIWNNRERLKPVKRFVIAVDDDLPGRRLAADLVRRLSASRCLFVTYPEGCKDLNEVRVRHGAEAVAKILNSAQPYPVSGLYRLREFPPAREITTCRTGWATLDAHLKPFLGELMFVLGIPGHGKSAFAANLVVNLCERYGWRAAIFGPEEPTVPFLRDKLRRLYLRGDPREKGPAAAAQADAWIDDRFLFIAADPSGRSEEEAYLDWILDRATDAVLRDGIRLLVLDPWNEIEQSRRPRESQTDYTGRAIRMLNRFRHAYGVMVIVLIHPTKEVGRDGTARAPTPYDADGSAHWYNKADHFVIIHRPDDGKDEAVVRIAKVKFEGTGEKGNVRLKFDRASARFEMLAPYEAPL